MGLPVVGKAHEARSGEPFIWFIYGSSLDRGAFQKWAQEHGYEMPDFASAIPTRLQGYRLAFDVQSRFWGGAVASLVEDDAGHVEGIALPMPGAARGLVDHKEGAISGLYAPFSVELEPLRVSTSKVRHKDPAARWAKNSEEAPPVIHAVAYRAAPDRRLAAEEKPSPSFVATLITGARDFGLSREWIASLEAVAQKEI